MGLHRALGHEQVGRDLRVGGALGDLDEHLALAIGEDIEPGVFASGRVGQPWHHMFEQPAGGARRHNRLTRGHRADRIQQVVRAGVLEHETGCAGLQGCEDVFVQVEGGQHQHLGP